MPRVGMKRKNADNGLAEKLAKPATGPSDTNGQGVVKRGRAKKKAVEDAILDVPDANEKAVVQPANETYNIKEQEIKDGEISTDSNSKAENGTKSIDEVNSNIVNPKNGTKSIDEVNSNIVNPKKRGKPKNNRTEDSLKTANGREKSVSEEESEVDIVPNLTKPDEIEEGEVTSQNGTALISSNNIDASEESKKPNKRGRKKKLDGKNATENAKSFEPETEKEEVVEKIPVKRGRRNLKPKEITEDGSTGTVEVVANKIDVPDVKNDEHVEDGTIKIQYKKIVPEKRGRKKAEPIPKEETVKATTKKEKKVKSHESVASQKKRNVRELLDKPLSQENINKDELLDIEAKTNEPIDKKKKKGTAKKGPIDIKECSVMLKKHESAENAAQELTSKSVKNKSKDKNKSTKSAEDQDNGEGSKGKNKRRQDGSEDDFKPIKPSKVPKKATKSSEAKNIAKTPDIEKLDFSNKSTNSNGKPWNLKISSWNINGVRAWLEKEGMSYISHEKPDIVALQETKCSDDKLPEAVMKIDGYHCYWVAGDKDGYSGVGLLSKQEPIEVKYGIGIDLHDNEGRVITAEYENFYVVAAYVPNAGRGLTRLDYRTQWDKDFRSYLKELDEKKPVILCGDLNVAHEEIDLANPKGNKKNAGFTKEEREGFSTLLEEGFLDTFRHLYPDVKSAYTFWTYMMNARGKNVGWRLDYFIISKRFADCLCDSIIRKDIYGSDHCPIALFLAI